MKDITAILINYTNRTFLNKAINSLNNISTRLKSIIVLQEEKSMNDHDYNLLGQIEFIFNVDPVKTLNRLIKQLKSPYVLLLQDTDYVSPTLKTSTLYLPQNKEVMETMKHNGIYQPVLIRTSFLKKQPFLPIPFKEALLPSWLTNIDNSFRCFKGNVLKQARIYSSKSQMVKQEFIQKYQLDAETNNPSLTVVIANYNMDKYIETAIVSCLLQNEKPEQILIIDDGSTDSSYKKIQKWKDEVKINIFHQENAGKAKALNYVLPYVTSNFMIELDADDWLDPDAISSIKKYLSNLTSDVSLLYGNLRKWKQVENSEAIYKKIDKGAIVNTKNDLLNYRFPLGPRIYRTSILKQVGGFPVTDFENGRLYEDVSMLIQLLQNSRFCYKDFTIYNVRQHKDSITKKNLSKWKNFKKGLI
ncbi:glycosyltransferase family A protein [Oceanobacillus sp. Castelsardo]|uniref:glycosyltransferase family 2 protein n=1 Tax=Oceanobacillus sp. Castelsardo TaxID=1851204 RepID=UPI0009EE11B2|nr:glycosyltransferase family A protein [Oceanobacillus sp. Castelsardo]